MEVDLDMNNYDLASLLGLFKMPLDFDADDMRRAKKVVLATHPDKSRLDKKYFLFFSKAYKILLEIYGFKKKRTTRNLREYNDVKYQEDKDESKQKIVNVMTTNGRFLETFNALFEKHYIKEENDGYGTWLTSNDDVQGQSPDRFKEIKTQSRALSIIDKVEGSTRYTGNIIGESTGNYGTDQYEDLKHAYTNGLVLGVDETDYREGPESLDALRQARTSQQIEPLTNKESLQQINHSKQAEDKVDTTRVYRLVREQEQQEESVNDFWSSLLQISSNK